MKTLQTLATLIALAFLGTAQAKDDPETKALKQEWRAAKQLVVVQASPGVSAQEAHDRIVRKLVSKGALIKADAPYQVTAEINMADVSPGASMFVQALAGDPRGSAPIARIVASFIEENGEPVVVRYCARIVMTNRYGGEQAGDCTESFKNWRQVTDDLRALLSAAPAETQPVSVQGFTAESLP